MQPKKFYVGIKGFIFSGEKLLLLQKAGDGFWEAPGGRISDDESIEQALVRELKEELPNIKNIRPGRVVAALRLPKDIDEGTSLTLIYYRVEAGFDGEPQISDEHSAWAWVNQAEAQKLMVEKAALVEVAFTS